MKALLLLSSAILASASAVRAEPQLNAPLAPAAQIASPPSATKKVLIQEYLRLVGRQQVIDTGSFLEQYALPGGAMWKLDGGQGLPDRLSEPFAERMAALRNAYSPHRSAFQEAYERHVNWEFTEAELEEIVAFLQRPVGQHFQDGQWRMEAYVGSELEQLEKQIVSEALEQFGNR